MVKSVKAAIRQICESKSFGGGTSDNGFWPRPHLDEHKFHALLAVGWDTAVAKQLNTVAFCASNNYKVMIYYMGFYMTRVNKESSVSVG